VDQRSAIHQQQRPIYQLDHRLIHTMADGAALIRPTSPPNTTKTTETTETTVGWISEAPSTSNNALYIN